MHSASPWRPQSVIVFLLCLGFDLDFSHNSIWLQSLWSLDSNRGRTGTYFRRSSTGFDRSSCITWFCNFDECVVW